MKLTFLLITLLFPLLGWAQINFITAVDCELDSASTRGWEYQEGIFTNKWGQLSCDGFCPREIDLMKNDQGRIFDDSLTAFYSYIDTTHRHFTLERSNEPYEYGQAHYMITEKRDGKLFLRSEMNLALNTSIHIEFDPSPENSFKLKTYLIYYSLSDQPPRTFNLLSGQVEFCEQAYNEGFLQLKFDLNFETEQWSKEKFQNWNGKIFIAL